MLLFATQLLAHPDKVPEPSPVKKEEIVQGEVEELEDIIFIPIEEDETEYF